MLVEHFSNCLFLVNLDAFVVTVVGWLSQSYQCVTKPPLVPGIPAEGESKPDCVSCLVPYHLEHRRQAVPTLLSDIRSTSVLIYLGTGWVWPRENSLHEKRLLKALYQSRPEFP